MNRTQSIALIRALAAVSWADGRLERAEESHLKSLAYRLGLGADELRTEVQPLLDHPLALDRAMDVVGELMRVIGSDADRRLFLTELENLFAADGQVSDEEQQVLDDVEVALAGYGAVDFLVGKLRGAFGGLMPARRTGGQPASAELAPFAKNKVLAHLLERLRAAGIDPPLAPAELHRAALEGALLARVATTGDRLIDEREQAAIESALADRSGLAGDALRVVLEALRDGGDAGMDRQRLCAEYNRVTTVEERMELVAEMFAVAGAQASSDVQEEIRLLANFLWIPTRDFVAVRGRARR